MGEEKKEISRRRLRRQLRDELNPHGMIDRIEQARRRYGIRQIDIAHFLGMSSGILGTWRSRNNAQESLSHVSDTFLWSRDWLMGNSDEMWRQEVLDAREKLRSWARHTDCQDMTVSERFVAVWEQFKQHVPISAELWSMYIWMWDPYPDDMTIEDGRPAPYQAWLNCIKGEFVPGQLSIRYASELTGLPEKWYRTGDPQYVRKLTDAERERLERFITSNGFEVEDIMAAMNALISK